VRTISVSRTVRADIGVVWDALADLGAHVEWMADARAIRFTSPTTEGVGTTFDCDTQVGPFRLQDRMEVTAWEPERSMAVRHVGLVTGEGQFTLHPVRTGTELRWVEQLQFPWWIPGLPAAAVLKWIWRRNLRRFEATL
jgi:carbon monoxide dehydrogenase subunit G